jgi:regulatory protein
VKNNYTKTPKKITEKYLNNSGLFYLERFPASTHQFKKVMTNKIKKSCYFHKDQDMNNCMQLLEKLINHYTDLGYLDDKRYSESLIHSLERKGKSKKYIYYKLKEKGINDNIINENLDSLPEGFEMKSLLITARKFKMPPFTNDESKLDKNKLIRAGFSYNDIETLYSMSLEEATDIIESLG